VSPVPDAPEGFVVSTRARVTLVVAAPALEELRSAGLDEPSAWRRRLAAVPDAPAGRGATAAIVLASGLALRAKRLRRGGLAAALWRGHFVGTRRVLDNLRLPLEARRRGVATPAPVALLIERAGAGLVRAWLAVEEIEGASDLRSRIATGAPPTEGELGAALRLVRRMHDAGVEHRDLNLGNLLVAGHGASAAFVVDLDRARLHPGPLPLALRRRALHRLERSYVKCCHPGPARAEVRDALYALYAGRDVELGRRLERGRRATRVRIGLHRLGWRR
jgi:3-deoxy-D-manno-octulosonic acid kinase